ncbi:MAG: hypothetical protein HYZ51_02615 [Candidatus Doudnabacteria bacterium]|nr:hypothetical protein [Candidatus Doudnabacteria bacterium]
MIDNIYFVLALTIALMVLDYVWTLKGFQLYQQKYSQYVKSAIYEANPTFQKSIHGQQYNFRHLLGIIASVVVLYSIYYLDKRMNIFGVNGNGFVTGAAAVIIQLVFVNALHLKNILLFKKINFHPDWLSGQLEQKYQFGYFNLKNEARTVLLIFSAVFVLQPSYLLFGVLLGLFVFLLQTDQWKKKYEKNKSAESPQTKNI